MHKRLLPLLLVLTGVSVSLRAEPPALVVVISIDQFRADYLERFRGHFGPGGFRLLMEHGAYFANCHHRHSLTKTAPGHAVMLTGVHADINGIIGNDWVDRETFKSVSCVGDDSVQPLGLPPAVMAALPGPDSAAVPRSPRNLLVTTVGDELKLARGGRPKVIGIAEKHRAAILTSGKLADAAYFMESGRMISSTYYMKELPEWVREWNAAGKLDAYFGKVWDRVLPPAAYAIQGPDDAPGEDDQAAGLGRTLPKKIVGRDNAIGPAFYSALQNTPFGNEVVADFARTAIVQENLGGRPGITDILCLGFSANDHVGHLYGPDSHEVMDMVVRTDRLLEEFLQFLDQRVGLQKCVIVLTADHGVPPLPERIHALSPHIPAGRIDGAKLLAACEAALTEKFGQVADQGRWLVRDDASLLILPAALKEKNLAARDVQAVVRDALLALDFVQAAYTREQLERGDVDDDRGRQMLLSFNRARSGDVFYQAKPYYFSRATGSNHGTPYNYDTHVPLLWYGAAVKPGVHNERVGVNDLAPTLARLLGLPAPPWSTGQILF
ncbi:MAG TPA: alkaline phosphatase family protein [Lacunisphaera sp.]|nr:alkaline phosphatase family protein [Lacunisphaera sp.]